MRGVTLSLVVLLGCSLARCTCTEPLPHAGEPDGPGGSGDGAAVGAEDGQGYPLFDTFAGDGKRDRNLTDAFVAGELPFCQRACSTSDDCCAAPPCDRGRHAVVCKAGLCALVGCKADADCGVAGTKAGVCKQVTDKARGITYGECGPWCAVDKECSGAGEKCVARLLETGDRLCGTPCTRDSECLPPSVCVAGKFCGRKEQRPCRSDADCSGAQGQSRCHLPWGRCYCANDSTCQTALGPLEGGTWRCR